MRPKIFVATDHDIDPSLIDPDALHVLEKLKHAGFVAYLVGGSVRDLLIRSRPKDFDISTSATPEQIKKLFRRQCLLIGRRFRLAHIRFGSKVFEVSTFRSGENEDTLVLRHNEYGTPEEDVFRRDFTINGLFYDPTNHSVIDFVGGWKDIHQGILRCIGDPSVRFKQDPVRMLRLLKFQARLGFTIHSDTENALDECLEEIIKSSQARILEEFMRMLESGYSLPFIKLLMKKGMMQLLFPALNEALEKNSDSIFSYLEITDNMHQNRERRSLRRCNLFSCIFYPLFERHIQDTFIQNGIVPHLGEIQQTAQDFVQLYIRPSIFLFPRKLTTEIVTVLAWQYRLTHLSGKLYFRPKLLSHPYFPLVLQFLKIRALVNNKTSDAYFYWHKKYRQYKSHNLQAPPRKREYREKVSKRAPQHD